MHDTDAKATERNRVMWKLGFTTIEFKFAVFHEAIHHIQCECKENSRAIAAPLLLLFKLLADAAVQHGRFNSSCIMKPQSATHLS